MADNIVDDVLLNWRGSMIPDMRGQTERVAEIMDRELLRGTSINSAVEIITAGGYPIDVVKHVAETRRREIAKANAPKSSEIKAPPEPPRRYADVADRIRNLVRSVPAADVLAMLSGRSKNAPSLVRLTERERRSFREIVATAHQMDDDLSLAEVDRWMRPHIETAIADSEILAVKLAENDATNIEVDDDGMCIVEDVDGRRAMVDPSAMSCTCPRYILGAFAHTGLACEHILYVRDVRR